LPISGVESQRLDLLYTRIREIELNATGRSKSGANLSEKKRLAYLGRFVRGEMAVRHLLQGQDAPTQDLYAIARSFRDLVLPRVNIELTICGGLPPFSAGLASKLVVAHSADREVTEICRRPPGEIASSVFDRTKLASLLPDTGAVLLTTKGLFPRHSAQYERATVPSRDGVGIHLQKIGLTQGATASLLSRRTYVLAMRLLDRENSDRAVSDHFGSGGSKRQRRIENAIRDLGLTEQLVYPRIERPIYAAQLVENPRDVCLAAARPKWRTPRTSRGAFSAEATQLWRDRWLETASRRIRRDKGSIEGVGDWLQRRSELKSE